MFTSAVGMFAIKALKAAAVHQGTEIARIWWADRSNRDTSRDPSTELH
jgi:hypothetical protein